MRQPHRINAPLNPDAVAVALFEGRPPSEIIEKHALSVEELAAFKKSDTGRQLLEDLEEITRPSDRQLRNIAIKGLVRAARSDDSAEAARRAAMNILEVLDDQRHTGIQEQTPEDDTEDLPAFLANTTRQFRALAGYGPDRTRWPKNALVEADQSPDADPGQDDAAEPRPTPQTHPPIDDADDRPGRTAHDRDDDAPSTRDPPPDAAEIAAAPLAGGP